jgi:hypothetical protein
LLSERLPYRMRFVRVFGKARLGLFFVRFICKLEEPPRRFAIATGQEGLVSSTSWRNDAV